MTAIPHSVVIVAAQAQWDAIRDFFASQGYELGDGVPMSADGNEPITHRGAHMWLTENEAQLFTLRQTPQSYENGYTFGQATACMAQFRAKANGANINHGATPNASRTGRLFLNLDDGARPTKREFFDEVATDSGVQDIEGEIQNFINAANRGFRNKN